MKGVKLGRINSALCKQRSKLGLEKKTYKKIIEQNFDCDFIFKY